MFTKNQCICCLNFFFCFWHRIVAHNWLWNTVYICAIWKIQRLIWRMKSGEKENDEWKNYLNVLLLKLVQFLLIIKNKGAIVSNFEFWTFIFDVFKRNTQFSFLFSVFQDQISSERWIFLSRWLCVWAQFSSMQVKTILLRLHTKLYGNNVKAFYLLQLVMPPQSE